MKSSPLPVAPNLPIERPAALFTEATAGLLSALVTLSYAVGYGAMIFSGSLAQFLPYGMPAILISCFVTMLIIALSSSIPFSISGPDGNATAILVGLTTGVATGVATDIKAHGGTSLTILTTVLATLALSSVVTGILLYAVGVSKRSSLIRSLPFPVLGGFLAGTGFLIMSGAFRMLTGTGLHWSTLGLLFALPWVMWLPALVVCVMLLTLSSRFKSNVLLPAGMAVGAAIFYLGLHVEGISISDARHLGLLFIPESLSSLRLPETLPRASIDWAVIIKHLPEFLVVAVVSSITILLNVTGLGLATGMDTDFDKELRVAGIANVATGALGGIVGYQSMNRSLLNKRAGASGRMSGVAGALACLAVFALFPGILSWFPKPVLVGLQLYLAFALLNEWLLRAYRKLGRAEYLLIPLIVIVIAGQGVVSGVVLGIAAACVLFVVNYSRVSIVRSEFDASARHSNVERSIDDMRILNAHGAHVVGTCLQGFIFFGTSNSLLLRVRARLAAAHARRPRFVVIDFQQADGLDVSTSLTFLKLKQYCETEETTLVLTALHPKAHALLKRSGVLRDSVKCFDDLDAGLEWIEDRLLAGLKSPLLLDDSNLRSELRPHFSAKALDLLIARLDSRDLTAGETLFALGDPGDAVYFVERGRVTVSLQHTLSDRKAMRLRSYGSGTIVGEMALYTQKPRSADVRADEPTRVCRLSLHALHRLETDEPEVAGEFHRFVVNVLASRLAVANDRMRASH